MNYYTNLFKTQHGTFNVITNIVEKRVFKEINEDLKRPSTVEKIKLVVFSMHP